jgi:hypothetical protein
VLRSYFQWIVHHLATPMIGWAAFMISQFEITQSVLSVQHGEDAPAKLGPRVVIFCHFDNRRRIHDHTRSYIDALQTEGFEIVFVTNSRGLESADLNWIRRRAARVVIRRNLGFDFAAWRDAMAACQVPSAVTSFLLIANDSVYGPLRPLGPILRRIDFSDVDVWSATDSWQHRFHLQSFFIAFGPKAVRHEAFASFWGSVGNVRSKWWVVKRYELRMTRIFIAGGLRCKALWPAMEMVEVLREATAPECAGVINDEGGSHVQLKRPCPRSTNPRYIFEDANRRNEARILGAVLRHKPLNPTADLWRVLIEQGCPFLKRELLHKNPSRVPDVADWSSLVGRIDKSSYDVILRDLERSLKNRSP